MTFEEWYESHKEDSDEWYIGFVSGWIYIGRPKNCVDALRQTIQDSYAEDLQNHRESSRLLANVEKYSDSTLKILKKISKQIKDEGLYPNEVEDVQKVLETLISTESNINRNLRYLRGTVKEPTQPMILEQTEVREERLSCFGKKCLTLKGSVFGHAWDKEEWAKWLTNELRKVRGEECLPNWKKE